MAESNFPVPQNAATPTVLSSLSSRCLLDEEADDLDIIFLLLLFTVQRTNQGFSFPSCLCCTPVSSGAPRPGACRAQSADPGSPAPSLARPRGRRLPAVTGTWSAVSVLQSFKGFSTLIYIFLSKIE